MSEDESLAAMVPHELAFITEAVQIIATNRPFGRLKWELFGIKAVKRIYDPNSFLGWVE